MVDAVQALKEAFDAVATSPCSTFTTYVGMRLAPCKGSGKTDGRFAFFEAAGGAVGAVGAGDSRQTAVATVVMVLYAPIPATPTDSDETLLLSAVQQFWTALVTAKRLVTHGSRQYQVHSEAEVTTGRDRPPWSANRDHYACEVTFELEYTGATA